MSFHFCLDGTVRLVFDKPKRVKKERIGIKSMNCFVLRNKRKKSPSSLRIHRHRGRFQGSSRPRQVSFLTDWFTNMVPSLPSLLSLFFKRSGRASIQCVSTTIKGGQRTHTTHALHKNSLHFTSSFNRKMDITYLLINNLLTFLSTYLLTAAAATYPKYLIE